APSSRVERPEQAQRLEHRQLLAELTLLQLDPESAAERPVVPATPLLTEHLHLALVVRHEALEDLDRRRLAGAVRAEQAEALARAHLEIQPVDGDDVAV